MGFSLKGKWWLWLKCHCGACQPFGLCTERYWDPGEVVQVSRWGEIFLHWTTQSCAVGGTSPSPLKVSGGQVWAYPDLQVEKDVAADLTTILFVLLTCIAIGLVLWCLQYHCWHQQSALQDQLRLVCMAWDKENQSSTNTPQHTFGSSLHSYPFQAWERTKEIHSPAPF